MDRLLKWAVRVAACAVRGRGDGGFFEEERMEWGTQRDS